MLRPLLKPRGAALALLALAMAACGSDSEQNSRGNPLRIAGSLPPAYIGDPYSATMVADGGVQPYTYRLEGRLPRGVTFNGGRFAGTPQEKGSFEVFATVEDSALSRNFQKLTLTVSDPPPPG